MGPVLSRTQTHPGIHSTLVCACGYRDAPDWPSLDVSKSCAMTWLKRVRAVPFPVKADPLETS